MKKGLIITHAGSAHFDDMLAIALILATNASTYFEVERREPSPAELEDPATWVVDVGARFEPELRNFDHHQSAECPAAFVLVARYLGIEDTLSVLPWWHFKDSVDRIGPARSSQLFGAGDDLVNRNPVESWLVDRFAAQPADSLPLLKSFGESIISGATSLKRQVDFWKSGRRLIIAGVPAMIAETTESYGLEEFRRAVPDPPDIVISLDKRSPGWRLFRYDGARVDFSRLADCPEIEFAHNSGFLAKTRDRLPEDELAALVAKAIIGR
jgi:hypothetical protein